METYFNKKDLVKFGNYLLSEKRKEKMEDISEEKLSFVYDADIENFLESIKEID